MHNFEHHAMATQFNLCVAGEDYLYAESAAQRCFHRLDELEHILSRFVAGSDISRINNLKANGQLALDYETWEVIKQAIQVQEWTCGAFDIGVAEHMKIFQATKQGILNEFEMTHALKMAQKEKQASSLYLDPEKPFFYCVNPGMQFDLGGIGKGYALDQLAMLLKDMAIENYTINAGSSTLLTHGIPNNAEHWSHTLASTEERKTLALKDIVVSASGTFHQGNHIFDPRTGQNNGVSIFERIWVASKSATFSDAFATGLYLLSITEIEQVVEQVSDILWVGYSMKGKLHFIKRNDLFLKELNQ
ncbi:FAD:protein FMN transferase [Flagellimonas sp. 2504JD4-2]